MGLANWLTVVRIVLIPAFVTLLVYRRATAALVVFLLASLTDLLDGYIARSRGRLTRLGAFLDPMADKLLLTASFVTLTYLKVVPFWIAAVVISRDVVLLLGAALIHVAGGTIYPTPTWLGKASTFFQMVTVLAAMLAVYFKLPTAPKLFVWLTAIFTTASGIQYLYQGTRLLNPSSPREPRAPTLVP
ncbi:MAG: CDP-diacylglycerol--glycerol-3-phosphate 3-phosphatidyltransferase [Candidatus Rokubacteria bacterium]|nr:CDP-diacylglycerol--glycerol-3-phosphate 3-phosphatidyltransferase [Candidatus Rokubacteria bacterium]